MNMDMSIYTTLLKPFFKSKLKSWHSSLGTATIIFSTFSLCSIAPSAHSQSHSTTTSVDEYSFMTEEFPPVNFTEDGQLKGIAVDLLALVLQRLNAKVTIDDVKVYPWSRAYKIVQEQEKSVLFNMTRRPEREKLFKWAGPVAVSKNVILAKKSRQIRIDSVDDLKQYQICVVSEAAGELILREAGLKDKKFFKAHGEKASVICARKLNSDRVDLWSYDEITAKWIIKSLGLKPQDYAVAYSFAGTKDMYFAFHISTPDALINRFQNAIDELKNKPSPNNSDYKKILDKYQ